MVILVEQAVLADQPGYGRLWLVRVAARVGIPMAVAPTAALATIPGLVVPASAAVAAVDVVVSEDMAAAAAAATTTVVAAVVAATQVAAVEPTQHMAAAVAPIASELRR